MTGIIFAGFLLCIWLLWMPGRGQSGSAFVYALLLVGLLACLAVHPATNDSLAVNNWALYGDRGLVWSRFRDNAANGGELRFADVYREPPRRVESDAARNLVILYAESMERTYFDEKRFPGLITELRALEKESVSYINIAGLEGTGFTIGGMVASQCGLPLITAGNANSMDGMDAFMPEARCLGDIFKSSGYHLEYMGGADLSFAGKGEFYTTHGFDNVSGLQELKPLLTDTNYVSNWGLYDDALLPLFVNRFQSLVSLGEPFALVGLTMDTHHPSGHASRSCEDVQYQDGSNAMLNAVKCADAMVAAVVRQLRALPGAENTVFVVASDHLALKNDAWGTLNAGPRRNLLMVFAPDSESDTENALGSTLDTAPAILRYMGMPEASVGLGRDLIHEKTGVRSQPRATDLVLSWRNAYKQFWNYPEAFERITALPGERAVELDKRRFDVPVLITFDKAEVESIQFASGTKLTLDRAVAAMTPEQSLLWIDACQRVRAMSLVLERTGLCVFAGKWGSRQADTLLLTNDQSYEAADIAAFGAMPLNKKSIERRRRNLASLRAFNEPSLRQSSISLPGLDVNRNIEIRSTGGPGASSFIKVDGVRVNFSRGLNLVALAESGEIQTLGNVDPCGLEESQPMPTLRQFLDAASTSQATADGSVSMDVSRGNLAVIVHDSARCTRSAGEAFEGLPIVEGLSLEVRQPYVALFAGGEKPTLITEYAGDRFSALSLTVSGGESATDITTSY
ncbi:sulfatase-like hydrolase/transferase [Halioglobus pacificus]|nr:sulfatase-like hydrolase/transferase [Halioglobus pacificus]